MISRSRSVRLLNQKRGYLGTDWGAVLNTVKDVSSTANQVVNTANTAANTYKTLTTTNTGLSNVSNNSDAENRLLVQKILKKQAEKKKAEETQKIMLLGGLGLGALYLFSKKGKRKK